MCLWCSKYWRMFQTMSNDVTIWSRWRIAWKQYSVPMLSPLSPLSPSVCSDTFVAWILCHNYNINSYNQVLFLALWFACDIWCYRNVFWLIDWLIDWLITAEGKLLNNHIRNISNIKDFSVVAKWEDTEVLVTLHWQQFCYLWYKWYDDAENNVKEDPKHNAYRPYVYLLCLSQRIVSVKYLVSSIIGSLNRRALMVVYGIALTAVWREEWCGLSVGDRLFNAELAALPSVLLCFPIQLAYVACGLAYVFHVGGLLGGSSRLCPRLISWPTITRGDKIKVNLVLLFF